MIEWIRNSTQYLTEAARQLVFWAVGLGLIQSDFAGRPWDDTKTMLTVSALSGLLAVIASKTTVSSAKVEQRKQESFDKGVAAGVASTGSGTGSGYPTRIG